MKNILSIIAIIVLYACTDNPVNPDAIKMSKEDIFKNWNYYGFSIYYDKYVPVDSVVNQIKASFKPGVQKFIIFTSPSCYSCGKMDSLVPFMLKVFDKANISDTSYELYDTRTINSSHPYKSILKLEVLPSVYLFNSGTLTYSILDSFRNKMNSNQSILIEQAVLEALK